MDEVQPRGILGSRRVAAIGVAGVAIWTAWRASVDLDPQSLWLDDAWVVALARSGSWSELHASPSSAPVGFKLLVAVATRFGSDLEVAAQSTAFVFALGAILLVGWLGFRLTRNAVVATCAAAWLGFDESLLLQMVRVKPYSLDAFVVAAQGLAFTALVERYSRRRIWTFVAVVLAGLPFSSLSVFPALAALPVSGIALWRRGVRDIHVIAAGLVLLGAIADAAVFAGGAAGAGELRDYWVQHYLPTSSIASFTAGVGRWIGSWGGRLLHDSSVQPGLLPLPGALALALALPGALQLWLLGRRAQLCVGALLLAGVALASSLGVLPLGVQRVETFMLPFAAILIASAAGLAARLSDRRAAIAASVLLPLLAVVQLPSKRVKRYPVQHLQPVVEVLAREYRPGDALWSNIHGTFALAVYGPWPVEFEPNGRLGIPHAVPQMADFSLLDGAGDDTLSDPPDTDRVFAFVCSAELPLLDQATALLREAGYRERGRVRGKSCQLDWYDR